MDSQLINQLDNERTFALVFSEGEQVVEGLLDFAQDNDITAAQLTGIGAFQEVTLGYFDLDKKDYHKIPIYQQVEVLSLVGNLSRYDGKPRLHAHVVLGKRDGTAHGGHLLAAHVRPTLEIVLVESPAYLRREFRPEYGLALLNV